MTTHSKIALIIAVVLSLKLCRAENAASPIGDPVLETPTLQCLGAYWLIHGDDNRDAHIEFYYRKEGDADWKRGPDLFRNERMTSDHYLDQGGKPRAPAIKAPADGWLFAGSIFFLQPDTAYELKLNLTDPDGGSAEKTLKGHTIAEPIAPKDLPQFHVVPGDGGGTGTADDPFKGIDAAQAAAKPGVVFLLHAGTYKGHFKITKDGNEDKPIVWRGAGDGVALLDAGAAPDKLNNTGTAFDLMDRHDVWLEKLSIRGAHNLCRVDGAHNIVVRRCHLYDGYFFVVGVEDPKRTMGRIFVCDNLIEGNWKWPTTKQEWHDYPEVRGVWLGGTGNCVCYNRIRHVKDGVDMADSARCDSNDYFNNEISECFDDGCELDGSERNTRLFHNRFTNVMMGISFQPIYGGPAYAFRNVVYNCQHGPFKLHNTPWGAVMIHNTIVKNGVPWDLSTQDPVYNAYSRNNLILGTQGRAMNIEPKMIDCDLDYDGLGGYSGDVFMKWNGAWYKTPDEARANSGVEKHSVLVDPKTAFASGLLPPPNDQTIFDSAIVDVRLKEGSAAIDAGVQLPGLNDGFTGKAPDLGALELGEELPHYGPRLETP